MTRRRFPQASGWPDERTSMVDALRIAHQARQGLPPPKESPPPPQPAAAPTAWIMKLVACGPSGIVQLALPALLDAAYVQGRHDAMMDCRTREEAILRRYRNPVSAARARRNVLERAR